MMCLMTKIKVAIIGAGPSGFGAAEVLRSKPYRDAFEFTIYESNNYVGGKCRTVLRDGAVANGKMGGYEVGAGYIPTHARSYKDLMDIIKRYDVSLRSIKQPGREIFDFVEHGGRRVSIKQLKPRNFIPVLSSYLSYAFTYVFCNGNKNAGFTHLSKRLLTPLNPSNIGVYKRFSHVVQGFGYADIDDLYLRPMLPYYHRYLDPMMRPSLSMINGGTQGLWAKVTEHYSAQEIKLNTQVLSIERFEDRVVVATKDKSEAYDYLIIATPLKPTLKYLDFTPEEKMFVERMKHNHFVTVLCEVTGINAIATFNLSACNDRSRVGDVVFCHKEHADQDTVTLNLYVDPKAPLDDAAILDSVERSLRDDFDAELLNRSTAKIFHWEDYFGHLGISELQNAWYDTFDRDLQGKKRTLFVSSGLHMETVGASVQYATRMTKEYAESWVSQKT